MYQRRQAATTWWGWFNWRVLAAAFVTGVALTCASLIFLWGSRQVGPVAAPATAILNVIPAPTSTPIPPTAPAGNAETTTVPPSPVPGVISLNAYVQVSGTSGGGLRLRAEPGLNGSVLLLGSEAEIFIVKDGPRDADGYTWWYLVGPFDETRAGWAVANYLVVVQGP